MKLKRIFSAALALVSIMTGTCALADSGLNARVTSIQCDGGTVGRCATPSDFTVNSTVSYCGKGQSLSYPMQLFVNTYSSDGRTMFSYCSAQAYIQLVEYSLDGASIARHQDGVYDSTTMTPMLQLMTADGYADYVIKTLYPDARIIIAYNEEITDDMQAQLDAATKSIYDQNSALIAHDSSMSVDGAYVGVAERGYTFELNGEPYWATVTTAVQAVQMTQVAYVGFGTAKDTFIAWTVPAVYVMVTPQSEQEARAAQFDMFVMNTAASSEFNSKCTALSNQIRTSVLNSRSLSDAGDYCRSSVSGLTDSADSYDNTERVSDYILSQDDYALPDGKHIKIPTSYDYVYYDGNGNVYATDSALDVPAGMDQLEKSH